MTGPYEWNPMPHVLDVTCPRCRGAAVFELAEVVRVRRNADLAFFEASSLFECRTFEGDRGGPWRGAVYYARLHGPAETTIVGLPDGYAPSDWAHPTPPRGADPSESDGAIACGACGLRARHALRWPADARYRIEYRGHELWAWHRESALELRRYIASTDRGRAGYRWELFLRHVPAVFLAAKARATVVKRLDRLL